MKKLGKIQAIIKGINLDLPAENYQQRPQIDVLGQFFNVNHFGTNCSSVYNFSMDILHIHFILEKVVFFKMETPFFCNQLYEKV